MIQPFSAAPHHDVLALLVQVSVLLLTARGLGELAQRSGQPSVVGEILAGIVLGPSMLSGAVPFLGTWLVPQSPVQGHLLELMAMLGAMFLLLITGLETDLVLIRQHARTALGAAGGGIVVPFASGFFLGQWLPDWLLANGDQRLVFALFVATAMSISAIPVIAKVLIDLNLMRRDIGQTIIAAGMTDDTVGWILLSIVAGLAHGEAVGAAGVMSAVARVGVFMVATFTVGRWLAKRALDVIQDEVVSPYRLLTLVMVCTVGWGAIAQVMGLEAMLGAFVMGIVFGQMPRLPEAVHDDLRGMALGVFSPVFFGVAGLKVNVVRLFHPVLLAITVLVILVATFGKVVGTYLGARYIGRRDHWTALSFGAGMNARGAMEIIVATIGLSLGILTQDMFSIIVLMAMATSLMAPPGLRWVLRRVQPAEAELRRLRQEELTAGSRVATIHRVLVPVRWRPDGDRAIQMVTARLLQKMAMKADLSVTLLTVVEVGGRAAAVAFLEGLRQLFQQPEVVTKVVEAARPAEVILEEAQKDYDLLVLGASEPTATSDVLFTSVVDYVVRAAPCLTMLVQARGGVAGWSPKRILAPTNGTLAAKHAAEVAFALATGPDEEVRLLTVVLRNDRTSYRDVRSGRFQQQLGIAYQIVQEPRVLGESFGVRVSTDVVVGDDVETVVLETAKRHATDLIVLGTALRVGSDRLFLGSRVERILRSAPCPVVVVNAP